MAPLLLAVALAAAALPAAARRREGGPGLELLSMAASAAGPAPWGVAQPRVVIAPPLTRDDGDERDALSRALGMRGGDATQVAGGLMQNLERLRPLFNKVDFPLRATMMSWGVYDKARRAMKIMATPRADVSEAVMLATAGADIEATEVVRDLLSQAIIDGEDEESREARALRKEAVEELDEELDRQVEAAAMFALGMNAKKIADIMEADNVSAIEAHQRVIRVADAVECGPDAGASYSEGAAQTGDMSGGETDLSEHEEDSIYTDDENEDRGGEPRRDRRRSRRADDAGLQGRGDEDTVGSGEEWRDGADSDHEFGGPMEDPSHPKRRRRTQSGPADGECHAVGDYVDLTTEALRDAADIDVTREFGAQAEAGHVRIGLLGLVSAFAHERVFQAVLKHFPGADHRRNMTIASFKEAQGVIGVADLLRKKIIEYRTPALVASVYTVMYTAVGLRLDPLYFQVAWGMKLMATRVLARDSYSQEAKKAAFKALQVFDHASVFFSCQQLVRFIGKALTEHVLTPWERLKTVNALLNAYLFSHAYGFELVLKFIEDIEKMVWAAYGVSRHARRLPGAHPAAA